MANDSGIKTADECYAIIERHANSFAHHTDKIDKEWLESALTTFAVGVVADCKYHPTIAALKSENARLSAEVESQSWVRCEDRLPDGGKDYLVTVDDDSVDAPTVFYSHWDEEQEIFTTPDHYKADIGNVIAWMPLPKPFEETKANEAI